MAATTSSTSIPPAPTTTRCHLFRSAQALDASTKGRGVKTRNVIPISCTSPPDPVSFPKCLQANAWPISWKIFTITSAMYNRGRFSGLRTAVDCFDSSSKRPAIDQSPAPMIAAQKRKPYQVNTLPTAPTHRSSARSGSSSGMRSERKLIRKPFTSRRVRLEYRRKRSLASMVRFPCSRFDS